MKPPALLDTTLRDGSYVIDFQFTAEDTSVVVAELSRAGVDYIEVGHGLGLGASRKPDMRAAESDRNYLESAAAAAGETPWGCFLIPGIAEIADLVEAARAGMKFVRIGTDVTEVERARPFISKAQELGLEVFANFMKTYAVDVECARHNASLAVAAGANHVCVVDSAGGMLPIDVSRYVRALAEDLGISTGFHGHNNLGLGIANGMAAVEAGASIVDCSLRGMGRSAGNTVIEIFALALKRMGLHVSVDVNRLLSLAERIIDPLVLSYNQTDSLGVISGYAQFHSSFLGKVLEYAEKHRADPRELIVALTARNLVSAPEDLLEELASELNGSAPARVSDVNIPLLPPSVMMGTSLSDDVDELLVRITGHAKKWRKKSVLNLLTPNSSNRPGVVSSVVYEGPQYVLGSAEVTESPDLEDHIARCIKQVDYLLVDLDSTNADSKSLVDIAMRHNQNDQVIVYSDSEVWLRATVRTARSLAFEMHCSEIRVLGKGRKAECVRSSIEGESRYLLSGDGHPQGESRKAVVILCEALSGLELDSIHESVVLCPIVDVLTDQQISDLTARSNLVVRLEMQRELHAEIDAKINSLSRARLAAIDNVIEGVRVVAGGRIGIRGSVVVDSLPQPRRVIGIADGRGNVLREAEMTSDDLANILIVRQRIARERA